MMFHHRAHAAELLLKKLSNFKDQGVVVAAIPRGAVPMGEIIANGIHAPLTAILVHKISHPENKEFALGCVGESGIFHYLPHAQKEISSGTYLKREKEKVLALLKERRDRYHLPQIDFKGKTVIIVDDGIATGATTICAVDEVKTLQAKKIVLATPVSSPEASEELSSRVDEFIALYIPPRLYSIGEFYDHFPQVDDAEVESIFKHQSEKKQSPENFSWESA